MTTADQGSPDPRYRSGDAPIAMIPNVRFESDPDGRFGSKAAIRILAGKGRSMDASPLRITLPPEVADIYRAVDALSERYPGRPFTPDGHMIGSIGEVVAAEAFGLQLYEPSKPIHDGYDSGGDVQIKITSGRHVSMYSCCDRLLVLRVVSPQEAEVVYDGSGEPAWAEAGPLQKNGQRRISIRKLRAIAAAQQQG